ncbi:twin transmembrane helix small protein [Kordiimonas sp.]|uniref:twin transmembrane helix small protein n=1 Tax=Kordiimonas sp. TaxID=1970157 RepID=UPI003A923884
MNFLFFLGLLFMFITLVVFFVGVGGMSKGGDFNKKYGNKLMQARVACQALAILCFVLWAVSN